MLNRAAGELAHTESADSSELDSRSDESSDDSDSADFTVSEECDEKDNSTMKKASLNQSKKSSSTSTKLPADRLVHKAAAATGKAEVKVATARGDSSRPSVAEKKAPPSGGEPGQKSESSFRACSFIRL